MCCSWTEPASCSTTNESLVVVQVVTDSVNSRARIVLMEDLGLTPEEMRQLNEPEQLTVRTLVAPDPEDRPRRVAAFAGTLVLFVTILTFGQFVAMGTVEEKQNRVVEIVLSRVKASQVLVGKVLGIGALGLVQLLVLAAAALVAVNIHRRRGRLARKHRGRDRGSGRLLVSPRLHAVRVPVRDGRCHRLAPRGPAGCVIAAGHLHPPWFLHLPTRSRGSGSGHRQIRVLLSPVDPHAHADADGAWLCTSLGGRPFDSTGRGQHRPARIGWLTCLHRGLASDRQDGQAARRMEVDGRLTSESRHCPGFFSVS